MSNKPKPGKKPKWRQDAKIITAIQVALAPDCTTTTIAQYRTAALLSLMDQTEGIRRLGAEPQVHVYAGHDRIRVEVASMTEKIREASGNPEADPYGMLLADMAHIEQPALLVAKVETYE